MSAWLVEKGHIDVLVQGLFEKKLIELSDLDAVGAELWLENHLSLNARYGDEVPAQIEYRFEGVESPLEPAHVLRAISCFDYQSCEHQEWETSTSWERLKRLRLQYAPTGEVEAGEIVAAFEKDHGRIPWGHTDVREAVKKS